nr:amino acid ABC transporter ATP-binding protein [Corynebacterium pacaense]
MEIRDVHKFYGEQEVLRGISLTVSPGEVVSLIGPSGSGKSTLLRTINHLEPIDAGEITVDGEYIGYRQKGAQLHELPEREVLRRRARVGIVFQNFNLFPHLTALENVAEGPTALKLLSRADALTRARDLLNSVGLGDKEHHYPRQLSGGQQQRVAIARALALDPDVMLFDEPTSALDPELVGEVLSVIRELAASGKTLIIVTHEISFAREISDRIALLSDGALVEIGPPGAVLDNPRHDRTRTFINSIL